MNVQKRLRWDLNPAVVGLTAGIHGDKGLEVPSSPVRLIKTASGYANVSVYVYMYMHMHHHRQARVGMCSCKCICICVYVHDCTCICITIDRQEWACACACAHVHALLHAVFVFLVVSSHAVAIHPPRKVGNLSSVLCFLRRDKVRP